MTYDNNTQAFFTLLKAGLWEQDVRLSQFGDIDYSEIFRLAEEQSVVGLVAAGIEHVEDVKIPKEELLQFVGHTLQLEQQNNSMNSFIGVLVDKMRRVGIYTLLVKGQGVARCYERPLWRACGDIDFFLSEENYQKAKSFLESFTAHSEKEIISRQEISFIIDSFIIELHGTLRSELSYRIDKALDQIRAETFYGGSVRSWDNSGVQIFQLIVENESFYVFTHILQHFYKEGVGLRQICDWCRLLWTYKEKLDLRALEYRIREAGLMTEWKAFGAYAVEYLGMPVEAMPFYSNGNQWKKKAKRINIFVLNVGNMGHNRDSHYMKYPYLARKCFSAFRRIGDLVNHAMIFPLDSVRFSLAILKNGVASAMRGE